MRSASPREQSPLVFDVQDGVATVGDVKGLSLQLRSHDVCNLKADLQVSRATEFGKVLTREDAANTMGKSALCIAGVETKALLYQ